MWVFSIWLSVGFTPGHIDLYCKEHHLIFVGNIYVKFHPRSSSNVTKGHKHYYPDLFLTAGLKCVHLIVRYFPSAIIVSCII